MVLEIAFIQVAAERRSDFEAAAGRAIQDLFPQSPGFRMGELRSGVERGDTYALMLSWDRIEDHLDTFVNSPLFAEWVERTEGMIVGDPVVEHWESVAAIA